MNLVELLMLDELKPKKRKMGKPKFVKLDLMIPRIKETVAEDVDNMTILRCDGDVTWYLTIEGEEYSLSGYDLYPGTYISRRMEKVAVSNRSQQGYVVVAFNVGPGMWPGHARFREVVTR